MNFNDLLSQRTSEIKANAIREILKVASKPGMTSLAGGLPAPEVFPTKIIGDLMDKVLSKYGAVSLQYDPTEGFMPLREDLSISLGEIGIAAAPDDVLITSGSQGALDSVGKILISKGDKIAVESPTYLGAIQAFNPYGPEYVSIESDDGGIIPDSLEMILKTEKIKFIYSVPTFQNPSGRTISMKRRLQIAEIIEKYNVLLVEDDPYSALRYGGEAVLPIKSIAPENVIYIGTLSKVFAPGLRIGFVAAPKEIQNWLVLAKQGIDLHTSTINQALSSEYIRGGFLKEHLPSVIQLYERRLEAMLTSMAKYFPENYRWSKPEGGMFVWARGPEDLDIKSVYDKCVERGVAFVPGHYFYAVKNKIEMETMRLNFTMNDAPSIDRGIRVISEVLSGCN